MFKRAAILCLAGLAGWANAASAPPSADEMWAIIQQQQTRIEELNKRLAEAERASARSAQQVQITEERLDTATDYIERVADQKTPALGRTTFGGYGEFQYKNLDVDDADNVKEADYHRFVGYIGHEFTDRIRFYSEVELEHALVEDTDDGSGDGEFELEQAYIEIDLGETYYSRYGLFLVPVSILNIDHEPDTFYGVERNDVESVIIPTTWWEGGASIGGRYDNGLAWDFAVTTGLEVPTTGSNAFRIRSGRQKVSEAVANDLAYTAQVRYTGIPGLQLAGTVQYQEDLSQENGDGLDEGQLVSVSAVYARGPFALRALWAGWNLDGDAAKAADADEQTGWYLEPSYRFALARQDFGVYARYEDVDAVRSQDKFDQWEAGLNYWPTDGVVFKFDIRDRSHDDDAEQGQDFTGFDLGVGYSF